MSIETNEVKAKWLFNAHPKVNTLFCIADGNFWLEGNEADAIMYSKKLNMKLSTFKREDMNKASEVVEPIKVEVESKPKINKSKTK